MGMMSKFFVFFVFFASVTNMFQTIDSQAPCLGDIDNNLSVDVNDLLGILSNFGMEGVIREDIDMNGSVDVNDILLVLSNFGMDCSVEPLPDEHLPECVLGDDCGDQVWTECGTSCPAICGYEPMICNMMCNVGYQRHHGLWWDGDTGNWVGLESI